MHLGAGSRPCIAGITFNSLFEMLARASLSAMAHEMRETFNSLFEMHEAVRDCPRSC